MAAEKLRRFGGGFYNGEDYKEANGGVKGKIGDAKFKHLRFQLTHVPVIAVKDRLPNEHQSSGISDKSSRTLDPAATSTPSEKKNMKNIFFTSDEQ